MQSFRTELELENPVVEQDIIKLEKQIRLYREGKIDEDKFRSLRLVRGIYGQRQPGVQMIRIKFPQGKITSQKLFRVSDVADTYSNGILHLTTRQDIQIHYVSLDVTPQLWAELEQDEITIREACGNTVRNITASAFAGIDYYEPFDVSPYAQKMFEYFLRNPICGDMGRKIKIAFSSSEVDSAFTFMHDFGFIPKIQIRNGQKIKGFKVLVGGGLGQQPVHAFTAFEFLEEEKIIPFTEAALRVFDRYGERNKRMQARLKFLIKELGQEEFLRLVEKEQKSLLNQVVRVSNSENEEKYLLNTLSEIAIRTEHIAANKQAKYSLWKTTNTFRQKQTGYYAVGIKITQGNISTALARKIAHIADIYTGDDMRITASQNLLLRFVPEANLPFIFNYLDEIGLANVGFETTFDVTTCPGTVTCNLGVASSMGLAEVLEEILVKEYPQFATNRQLSIKISGCMNACGQHVIANIGFQGMSMNIGKAVAPAFQVVLGGGVLSNGQGQFAEKTLKVLSRRTPDALRTLLNDYQANKLENELYNDYYQRQGKKYFFTLLAPFADTSNVAEEELIDWGNEDSYQKAVGIGECAGVIIDLISTLFVETEEKIDTAELALDAGQLADAAYHTYNAMIYTAKALLISIEAKTNSHQSIIDGFDREFIQTGKIDLGSSFAELALQVAEQVPMYSFVSNYLRKAKEFLLKAKGYRNSVLS
ncbi:HEPN domain-containing protein [Thermoflexibacter ruber]|uniref:Sulfite reductase (Ferredoxin) n=1 Tax=Thermoflexibacter ruber TaxID=1003 RepID=A0A1I2ITE4_9BACT|nr:HEPN domain-containing protein [Thermoflexibacter ruber]SFF43781.1 sulfite reductase (ferredoxin) [Thermoflexibacter ruber]